MKILVIEPEKAPYEKEIGDDIHDMQAIVGGCIERNCDCLVQR